MFFLDPGGPGRLAEPGAAAVGTGAERDRALDEGADVRLQRVDVLRRHRLLDLRDQSLVGEVDVVNLDLDGLLVEQVVELLPGELPDRLVRVEEAATVENVAEPVHAVAGDPERALVERLLVVVQLRQVNVVHRAPALAARTHAAGARERHGGLEAVAALDRDRAARRTEGTLKEYAPGGPACGFPSRLKRMRREHRVRVGRGADRGAGVGASAPGSMDLLFAR